MSFAVGRLDLSESRSTHAMSAMQRTDCTHRDSRRRKTGGRGPSAPWLLVLFLVPAAALAHLSVNSPSMLLAAAFLCWLWAEEVPKITRRALPLVGHSLWWLQDSLACSLQARVPLAPAQTSCGHPLPSLPQVLALSLLLFFLE